MVERTRLAQRLADQLQQGRDAKEADALWAGFEQQSLVPPRSIEAFDTSYGDPDALLDLMACALDAVKKTSSTLAHDHPVRLLAPALILAAAERYLMQKAGWREASPVRVTVRFQHVLAAAMAAAVAHDAGLRVVRSDLDDSGFEVANLVQATDMSSLGFTTVQDQAVAALLAARDAGLGPDHRSRRRAAIERLKAQGLPEPDVLRAELRQLSRAEKVRLMFMLQPNPDGTADERLIDFLQQDCTVPVWLHRPAADDADARRLDALQGSLMRYITGVHGALSPGGTGPSPASGVKPLIFVSYAHRDDQALGSMPQSPAELLRATLEAHSRNDGPIRYFFDADHLETGDRWDEKIQSALNECSVAVVMLSNGLFASDYVCESELPVLRKRFEAGAIKVLPIEVRACTVPVQDHAAWLAPLQRPVGQALTALTQHEAEAAINQLVQGALQHCKTTSPLGAPTP